MKRLFTSFLIIVLTGTLVIVNEQKTKFKTLKYLYSISGSKTVAGIHNSEPNATPARWTNEQWKEITTDGSVLNLKWKKR